MADLVVGDYGYSIVVNLINRNGTPFDLTPITEVSVFARSNSDDAIQGAAEMLEPRVNGRVKIDFTVGSTTFLKAGAFYLSLGVSGGPTLFLSITDVLKLLVRDII